MATNINNMREERRRRIMERGSDRMALITGRVQSLPPSPRYPSSPSSSRSTSSSTPYHQSLLSDQHQHQDHLHQQPNSHSTHNNNISAAVEKIKDNNDHGDKTLPDHKTTEEIKKEEHHSEDGSHIKKPQLRKLNNISSTTTEPKQPLLPAQPSSIVQKADTHKEPVHFEPSKVNRLNNLFTSKELNSCIIASGNVRIFCAFVIAILVVISYVDYPLFGINLVRSQSVVASRPLYLLLLTDLTIVVAQLLYLKKQKGFEQEEEEKEVVPQAEEEADNWEGAFKVLERGLVVYQAIRGIFMDCSVYTVVVVCGLSLV